MTGPCGSDYGPHVLACYGPDGRLRNDPTPAEDRASRSAADDGAAAVGLLLHWALPLLARARRIADHHADLAHRGARLMESDARAAELLADDIAALIGHSVTDQPPAPELDALATRHGLPVSLPVTDRRGTRGYYQAALAEAEPREAESRESAARTEKVEAARRAEVLRQQQRASRRPR